MLREDNLLCIRKRKFLVTTDSDHGRRVYPNLAGQMSLTGINQLWVADITYIRLETEFVYLAVVIDAFSRRVIGWAWPALARCGRKPSVTSLTAPLLAVPRGRKRAPARRPVCVPNWPALRL